MVGYHWKPTQNYIIILKHSPIYVSLSTAPFKSTLNFTGNTADYGGAVYVDDDTNAAGTCASNPKRECFFQVLAIHNSERENLEIQSMHFSDNLADIAGSTLYAWKTAR